MSGLEIPPRQVQSFKRFLERLPHGNDVDLVILKAHLLIEEQVNAIIRERLRSPVALLDEDRFESFYRIRLAQAFFEPDHLPWLWDAVIRLNKLRNRVAHSLEPKGRDSIMQNIVKLIPASAVDESLTPRDQFEFALWFLFEAIASLVDAPK